MKIGIVVCGFNSDYRINFAKEYKDLEIVGVLAWIPMKDEKPNAFSAQHG